MLPYHLRPPPAVSSRNNKKDKNKTANDDEDAFLFRNTHNNNGGPIQQAALQDLRELRQDFLLFLNSNEGNDDDDDDDDFSAAAATTATDKKKHHHVVARRPVLVGVAFGVFREVFRNAKVAALHSRFISAANRGTCDVNAHAQLLYAACFQLLHEPFQQHQQQYQQNDNEATLQQGDDDHGADDSSLCRKSTLVLEQHAIYAIFSLFALYETNPLPLAPSSITTTTTSTNNTQKQKNDHVMLSTLPCGLRDRENPKLVYRRQYRQGIRINRQGYARLLQVQELARARIAACCCCYQQQQEQKIVRTSQISEHGQSTSSWTPTRTCHCGAATDVLFVLDRLWSKLILSDYTGPRGLEGLAGHEDYPFPPSMQDFFDLANHASTKSNRTATAAAAGTMETGATTAVIAAATTNDTVKLLQEIMTSSHQHASNDDDDDDDDEKPPGSSTALLFSDSLQSHLQTYLSARRAIRLPTFNNNTKSNTTTGAAAAVVTQSRLVQERIRQALQPMFDQGKQQKQKRTDPFLQIVNASTMTMQHQAKFSGETSFADAITVCDDPSKHNNDDEDNDANTPRALEAVQGHEPSCNNIGDTTTTDSTCRQHKDAEESYELIIPSNLPSSLVESIQAAVRTLLDRDKDSFFTLQQQQQRQTATVGVATDGVEDDGSVATVDDDDDGGGGGAGHEALAALIAQASALSAGPMKNTRVTFLDTSTRGAHEDEGRISRKRQSGGRQSQKDDDDDISDASSTVGQRALEDLLMTTMAMGKSAAPKEQKKKQPTTPRKRARKGGAINEPRKRTPKNIGIDMEHEDGGVDEDSADDSEEEEEDEDESVGGEGNAALELLIGRAMM